MKERKSKLQTVYSAQRWDIGFSGLASAAHNQHSLMADHCIDMIVQETMARPCAGMCSPPASIPLLQMIVKLTGAKKIGEVGFFTGASPPPLRVLALYSRL